MSAKRLTCVITAIVLLAFCAAGAIVMEWAADWPTWVRRGIALLAFLLILCGAVLAYIWPALEQTRTFWWLDGEGIRIRRGVLWHHVITVPRRRIQHTDVSQGPIQRRFGLATLIVHTAGTHAYEVELEGITRETALLARDVLFRGAGGTAG